MNIVKIFKAQDIGTFRVRPVSILIETAIESIGTLDELKNTMDLEAEKLEQALHNSLPGGTYNRLLTRMMSRAAGCLVIIRED